MEKRRREPGPWSVRAPDGADTEGAITCKASLFRASSPVEERRAAGRGADVPVAGVPATTGPTAVSLLFWRCVRLWTAVPARRLLL